MKQSDLFFKTYKKISEEEEAKNSQFLIRAGFIEKVGAGIYNFLPLGLIVIEKIKKIIREELNRISCQEVLLANLHPQEFWQKSGRLKKFDVLFTVRGQRDNQYVLAPTHEEIIFPLVKKNINSYKDLPVALYQINTKYRDELRAKSGLLRNREFIMKDLYSFHTDEKDLERFKKLMDKTYLKIFKRCGLKAIPTLASGGTFSEFSTEFQVITEAGEDIIYHCPNCKYAFNKEIIDEKNNKCQKCFNNLIENKSIEVGNTFNLGTKFSEIFDVFYLDKNNQKKYIWAGCYGIGITRLLGAIVEVNSDEKGIIWPKEVSPFLVHLIKLNYSDSKINKKLRLIADRVYLTLKNNNIEVLFDDRENVSNGQKFIESDLIGLPYQIIVGEHSHSENLEIRSRLIKKIHKLKLNNLIKWFNSLNN